MGMVLVYPVLLYLGVTRLQPRVLAMVVIAIALLRFLFFRKASFAKKARNLVPFLAVGLGVAGIVLITDNSHVLLQVPAIVNIGLLGVFIHSAFHPPNMIERFAREDYPVMPQNAIRYCRKVFLIWCTVFLLNAGICSYLGIAGPHRIWLLWTTIGMYVFMGLVFGIEFMIRMQKKSAFDAALAAMQHAQPDENT